MPTPADLDPTITSFMALAAERMSVIDPSVLTVAELREVSDRLGNEAFKEVAEAGPENVSVVSVVITGGEAPVPVLVYTPQSADGPLGVHVLLHGGGWWQSSINDWISDVQCRERAVNGNCIVVSVEYRLAPEHQHPAALLDVETALAWVRDTAQTWGGDPSNISLGGVSAGANIGAGALVRMLDAGAPMPRFALFEAGVFDFDTDYPSFERYGVGFGLETAALPQLLSMYLADPADLTRPDVSPVRATNLAEFPPTHLITAEWDPTNGTSDAFADRLRAAGVAVTQECFEGQIHASPVMTKVHEPARRWRQSVCDQLRAGHRALVSS